MANTRRTEDMLCRRGHTVLYPSRLKILLTVLRLYNAAGQALTVRDIANSLDWDSPHWVATELRALREMGLIDYDSDRSRTVVPRCRVEVYREES